jgi:Holliday junction DNA helicase RuvB
LDWRLDKLERIISSELLPGDPRKLFPTSLDEFVGQDGSKAILQRAMSRAKETGEQLDHILLHAPPGLGKTSLAKIIAPNAGDISVSSLTTSNTEILLDAAVDRSSVLILDEFHTIKSGVAEELNLLMDTFGFSVGLDKVFKPFTLIGVTTSVGKIPRSLVSRFGILLYLDYYGDHDLYKITTLNAEKLDMEVSPSGRKEIAKRSRGVPRIANRLLKRLRDISSSLTHKKVVRGLEELGVDSWGLDWYDRKYLGIMRAIGVGKPIGIGHLAGFLEEDKRVLENVIEPYLLRRGLIVRTPQGRMITSLGSKALTGMQP